MTDDGVGLVSLSDTGSSYVGRGSLESGTTTMDETELSLEGMMAENLKCPTIPR